MQFSGFQDFGHYKFRHQIACCSLLAASCQNVSFTDFLTASTAIERIWGYAKRYNRDNCCYSIVALRRFVPQALASIQLYTARRFFLKSLCYFDIYETVQCNAPLTDLICRVYRSHRRVCDSTTEGAIRKAASRTNFHQKTLSTLLDPSRTRTAQSSVSSGSQGEATEDVSSDDEDAEISADENESDA